MQDTTRDLLQEEIEQLFESLKSLEPGSKEYASAASDLKELYKLKIEEVKVDCEFDEKYNRREMEAEQHVLDGQLKEKQIDIEYETKERELALKEAQLKEQKLDRYFKVGAEVGLGVATLLFYWVWMNRGLKFEENGTYCSKTFMGLTKFFKPTRK